MPANRDPAAALPRPIALVGYGVEGRASLAFLRDRGVSELTVFDHGFGPQPPEDPPIPGVTWVGEGDWRAALRGFGTVVRSPGVRPDHPGLAAARDAGARITSATALFLEACPGPVIGVTGTLGKGTTVSLIEAALRAEGVPCRVGGNIGTNPLDFLDDLDADTFAVLELSSFQLMGLEGRKPEVGVVLRTGEEHLDWHRDLDEYQLAKRGLLAGPGSGQAVIFCADSAGSRRVAEPSLEGAWSYSRAGDVPEGIGLAQGRVMRFRGGASHPLPELERLRMPGGFNLENAAAAALAVEAALALHGHRTLGPSGLRALAEFPGLPHRLEFAGTVGGVACYNDSYATRPDATLGAVTSFSQPLALILGGSEKHADFSALAAELVRHASLRRVVLIGTTAGRLEQAVREAAGNAGTLPELLHAASLPEAFARAREAVAGGGVLLFSPACASFDMFANYRERGEQFKALVAKAH